MDIPNKRGYSTNAELWSQLKLALQRMEEAKKAGDRARQQEIQIEIDGLKQAIKRFEHTQLE